MTRRKKKRTLQRKVGSFVGAGITIGVGTVVVSRAGGTSVLPSFRVAGSMMTPIGTATFGLHAIKGLKKLGRNEKKFLSKGFKGFKNRR